MVATVMPMHSYPRASWISWLSPGSRSTRGLNFLSLNASTDSHLTIFQPYDILPLIPVIEGAGGWITDWRGQSLHWEASPESGPKSE